MSFAEYQAAVAAQAEKFLYYVANAGAALLHSYNDEPAALSFAEHCALMYERQQVPEPTLIDY
jgi:hypothetical protein